MKKLKVKGLEEALANVPPEDREALRAEIKEMFERATPDNLPGKPVRPIADGVKTCLDCGGPLENGPTMQLPPGIGGGPLAGKLVHMLDCEACECAFMQEAKS